MASAETTTALNRIYATLYRSLPMYLGYAKPWPLSSDEQARETLDNIVADQRAILERIGELILEEDGEIIEGEFPMVYTAYHDLSAEFLVRRMIENQRKDIAAIEQSVEQLNSAPLPKAVAQEALGLAKGHLENLQELTQEPRSSAAS